MEQLSSPRSVAKAYNGLKLSQRNSEKNTITDSEDDEDVFGMNTHYDLHINPPNPMFDARSETYQYEESKSARNRQN